MWESPHCTSRFFLFFFKRDIQVEQNARSGGVLDLHIKKTWPTSQGGGPRKESSSDGRFSGRSGRRVCVKTVTRTEVTVRFGVYGKVNYFGKL